MYFCINALYEKSSTVYGRHRNTVTVTLQTEGCVQVKGILSISAIVHQHPILSFFHFTIVLLAERRELKYGVMHQELRRDDLR